MPFYLIYRWLCVLFFLSCFCILLAIDLPTIYHRNWLNFFIYMTNWGMLLLLARLLLDAIYVTKVYAQNRVPEKSSLREWLEFLVNISNSLATVICINFWFLVYYPERHDQRWYLNHFEHSITLVMCLLDLVASPTRPIRNNASPFYHIYQSFLVGLAYLAFTLVFEALEMKNAEGEDFLYAVISWRNLPRQTAVISVITLVSLPAAQGTYSWISKNWGRSPTFNVYEAGKKKF